MPLTRLMLLALALLALDGLRPAPLRAQSAGGVVVDGVSGLPVSGATVAILDRSVVTGGDGRFRIALGRAAADYRLHVDRFGYVAADTVIAAGAGDIIVRLIPSPLEVPGLRINVRDSAWDVGGARGFWIPPPRDMVRSAGITTDPLKNVATTGIATVANDMTATPTVRANRWDQTQVRVGLLRLWAPFNGLGLSGPTSGTYVSGGVAPVLASNGSGSLIVARPRFEDGPAWVEAGVNVVDAHVSTGGSTGGATPTQVVATATRSVDMVTRSQRPGFGRCGVFPLRGPAVDRRRRSRRRRIGHAQPTQ